MSEKHFRYTGLYFKPIDPEKDLIRTKSLLGRWTDKYYTNKVNRYFEIIQFLPLLPPDNSNNITQLLFKLETFEVKCLSDLVKKKQFRFISQSDADYTITNSYASKTAIKINDSRIEFELSDHLTYIHSFNDGLLLSVTMKKERHSADYESFGDFQFISFNEIDHLNLKYDLFH